PSRPRTLPKKPRSNNGFQVARKAAGKPAAFFFARDPETSFRRPGFWRRFTRRQSPCASVCKRLPKSAAGVSQQTSAGFRIHSRGAWPWLCADDANWSRLAPSNRRASLFQSCLIVVALEQAAARAEGNAGGTVSRTTIVTRTFIAPPGRHRPTKLNSEMNGSSIGLAYC